ncbi:MAG TPA: site-specific integrase [Terriglobia bacterium]|nr:site-specific integrase [Terriglobia bacterium]
MKRRNHDGAISVRKFDNPKAEKRPDVWQFRWMENGKPKISLNWNGSEIPPTRADAERAVEHLRIKVNAENPQQSFHSTTVGVLINRYLAEGLSVRKDTADSYRAILKNWIRPRWEAVPLLSVKTMDIEHWLRSIPRSRGTRAHIRNLIHLVFSWPIRWEMIDRNPVDLVRQSSRRTRIPRMLTAHDFKNLLGELKEPYRTMVLMAGCLGLRISEITALQWGDIDWEALALLVQRSFVSGKIYETKTEASRKPLPLDPQLAEVLLKFRGQSVYIAPTDFIFAGNSGKPRWQGIMMTDHIKPAAQRAGIGRDIGWHTFRHIFSSILHNSGTNMAVQKELLRHADISTTMNVYTQAVNPAKREAVHHVAEALLNA